MATWIQTTTATYKTGEVKTYGPTVRDADRMVEMLAQVSFLRQAGYDITLHRDIDNDYNTTVYKIHRTLDDCEIWNVFVRS